MYSLGIDLGGTNIKAGVVRDDYTLLSATAIPTSVASGVGTVTANIEEITHKVLEQTGLDIGDIRGVGVGCPGLVDSSKGIVRYSNNLYWHNYPLAEKLSNAFAGLPVTLGNDANAAALGEYLIGSARGTASAVIITLGTGVGTGIVIDGKIATGFGSGAGELGHMVIEKGGRPCSCGRLGCWEAYCSATGLKKLTRETMDKNLDSTMWTISENDGKISGRTAFIAARQGDSAGQSVVDEYISYLACGIANIINALQPEVISIGGGVGQEGENLFVPLREQVRHQVLGGPGYMVTALRSCTLGNQAGIIGAAMFDKRLDL